MVLRLINKTEDENKLTGLAKFFEEMVDPILGLSFKDEKSNTNSFIPHSFKCLISE